MKDQIISELFSGNFEVQRKALNQVGFYPADYLQDHQVRRELVRLAQAHEETFEKISLMAVSWPCDVFFPLYVKMLDSSDVVHVSAALVHYHFWHPHLSLNQKSQIYPRLIQLLRDAIVHVRNSAGGILNEYFCGKQVA